MAGQLRLPSGRVTYFLGMCAGHTSFRRAGWRGDETHRDIPVIACRPVHPAFLGKLPVKRVRRVVTGQPPCI
jgi:hypothetical protein